MGVWRPHSTNTHHRQESESEGGRSLLDFAWLGTAAVRAIKRVRRHRALGMPSMTLLDTLVQTVMEHAVQVICSGKTHTMNTLVRIPTCEALRYLVEDPDSVRMLASRNMLVANGK